MRQLGLLSLFSLFLILFLGFSTTITAQTAPGTNVSAPTVKVQTSLVTVPAIVTDKQGNDLEGLTQEDFVVKEDGKRQRIASFEHIQHANAPVIRSLAGDGLFSNQFTGEKPACLTIIAVDAVSTGITERWEARDQITKFIANNIAVNQPIALLLFTPSGLKVVHDFTTDPKVLVAGLRNEKVGTPAAESVAQDDKMPAQKGDLNGDSIARETHVIQSAFREIRAQNKVIVIDTLEALHEIAEAFTGIPGRKSLIWMTNGTSISFSDPKLSGSAASALAAYSSRTWRAMNAANMAVYPLDISDLINPAYASPAFALRSAYKQQTGGTYAMEQLAQETGGRMCYRRDNLDSCFKRASHDSEDYYMLSYYPDSSNIKAGWRRLEISLPGKDARIRARKGYVLQRGPLDADKMVARDMLAALGSPLEYTSLPVEVKIEGIREAEGQTNKKRVSFAFFVPPSGGFIAQESYGINLDFAALAKLPNATPAGQFSVQAAGSLKPELAEEFARQGIRMEGSMDLEPGEYQIKFVVRDNQTGRLGSLTAPIKVEGSVNAAAGAN